MTPFDHSFECSYDVEEVEELPTSFVGMRWWFPGALSNGPSEGLHLIVRPRSGAPWIGTFERGDERFGAPSGVFSTPAADAVCVVARGEGYIVSTTNPTVWENVIACPVFSVKPIASRGMLVFADYAKFFAYGREGLIWKTRCVSSDRLIITESNDDRILGEYWDASISKTVRFSVSLATGECEGGCQ